MPLSDEWVPELAGFPELDADDVRSRLILDEGQLVSTVNHREIAVGQFTLPSLSDCRKYYSVPETGKNLRVAECVADVRNLHTDKKNENAVFQVASQFNCLEMITPHATPESGVSIYQNDLIQGPGCCIWAGGGTIYRNDFMDLDGGIGQTANRQLNCLDKPEDLFFNSPEPLWRVGNGYCFSAKNGRIENRIAEFTDVELQQAPGNLMAGCQENTEIVAGHSKHRVAQIFCSALPLAYSAIPPQHWNRFPRLILDATYELAFRIAAENPTRTGCPKLYLALVGGGVFGNKQEWILSAIKRSLRMFSSVGLDVQIVRCKQSNPNVKATPKNISAT